MSKKPIGFFGLLRNFGITRVLKGLDLWVSVLLTATIAVLWLHFHLICISDDFLQLLVGVSAGLFGILFGAFSIVIALSDDKFVRFAHKAGLFHNLLFPFWYVSALYLLSIIFNLFALLCNDLETCLPIFETLCIIGIFFTFYSLTSTFYRVAATVKFGIYRAKFLDKDQDNKGPAS